MALTEIPIELSSTPGIVDNSNATAITIDSSNNTNFADNAKAIFGAGSDLQIYHNGSHSIISDVGTGNLKLGGTGLELMNGALSEYYLAAIENAGVYLYYDNAAKLTTTATGIDVTGTATMDALTVSSDTNGDPVLAHFYNVSTGAAAEATAYITNSATSSDGLFLQAVGSSFTTTGGFVQDAAVLGSGTGASGGLSLMTRANADMRFYTNGHTNERMRIDASGNLLVGTTSTINSGLGVFSKANSNQLVINSSNSNGGSLDFCNGGASASARIGGLTTGTATALQVQVGATGGVQLASGATSWTSMSDERLKDIIEPISDAVSKLLTLRTVIGKYKVDAPQVRRVFVIAQDVEKVLPEAVSKSTVSLDDPEEFLGVAYSELIPLLIAGFKEQQAIIESLTARIAALES